MRSEIKKTMLPWGPEKKLKWFLDQRVQRSYHDDVLVHLERLGRSQLSSFVIESYGNLTINPERFPLCAVRVGDMSPSKKNVLITGGVHGYETSGVKGALLFLEEHASQYTEHFNFVIAPCISPWAYETINRLDAVMENPNREFKPDGKAEESRLFMEYLNQLDITFDAHFDLHETTDSDLQLVPEEYAKNGLELRSEDMYTPDGFYLIGVKGVSHPKLEKAMIDSVRKVTHIAPADERGMILDIPLSQEGVIHAEIPGLCATLTSAKSALGAFTTEMYPDSPHFKKLPPGEADALCAQTQVACVRGALDFWLESDGIRNSNVAIF